MAIQSSLYFTTALNTRTFPSTKHIATKQHMALWRRKISDGLWEEINVEDYQLINNAGVLNTLLNTTLYDGLEVRVADTPDELGDSISDIGIVAGIANEITIVAGIESEVVVVSGINTEVVTVAGIAAEIADVASDPLRQAILDAEGNANSAAASATQAELEKWETEAEKLTATSYAVQLEDVPVNVYTSDGDGTFTVTPQAGVFSSLHYAAKASQTTGSIDGLDDVDTTGKAVTDLMTWDGVNWIPLTRADLLAGGQQQLTAPSINSPADTVKNTPVSYTVSGLTTTVEGTRKVILDMGTTDIDTPTSSEGIASIVGQTVEVTGVTSVSINVGANYTSSGTFSVQAKQDAPNDSNYSESNYSGADTIAVLLNTPTLDSPADSQVDTNVTYTISDIDTQANKIIFDIQSADFTYISVSSGSGVKVGNTIEITGYTGTSLTVTLQYTVAATYNNRAKVTDTTATYPDSAFSAIDSIIISSASTFYGGRGVFGPYTGSGAIDYITIATTGNATNFGDLTTTVNYRGALSGGGRGVFGGGSGAINVMDYITIGTTGNGVDFGDLTVGRTELSGLSNGTRGVFGGGGSNSNVMDYITIATIGNATDFGDLTVGRSQLGSVDNLTRGVFIGGFTGANSNVMDYITIATTGNATDFGDCTSGYGIDGCSSDTRGVFSTFFTGAASNIIEYITIATIGNSTDFGDLTVARYIGGACSNGIRACFGGGFTGASSNVIDYVTIATTGNATDFGDLVSAKHGIAGLSGD